MFCKLRSPLFTLSLLLALPASGEVSFAGADGIDGQYFVRLEDGHARWSFEDATAGPSVDEVATALSTQYGGKVTAVMDSCIQGFVYQGGSRDVSRLATDFRVRRVAQDTRVIPQDRGCIVPCPSHPDNDPNWQPALQPIPGLSQSPQPIDCIDPEPASETCESNWGLDRIDDRPLPRDGSYTFSELGSNANIYVFDSGIFAGHPEFESGGPSSRVRPGRNTYADVTGVGDPTDVTDEVCSRHGTSVASVAAGLSFGPAKLPWIHPIKFTDSGADSSVASWIASFDWVAENFTSPAVINLSYNGQLAGHPCFDELITCTSKVIDLGIPVVQSAGNKSDLNGDACTWTLADPVVGEPRVLVVGGMDQFDSRWERDPADREFYLCEGNSNDCGSNTGSCVDLWAPAAHIVSAHGYPSGQSGMQAVCHSSGTSFAAPHVTGVVALYLRQNPTATVAEVEAALKGSAWAGLLDGSIQDPDPGGPASNNLLLNSTLNLRPIAGDDHVGGLVDLPIVLQWSDLLANDSDPDGGSLEICAFGEPTFGTIVASGGGSTTYEPPGHCFIGLDHVDYTVCDDGGGQDTATVTLDLGGIVCPPPDD